MQMRNFLVLLCLVSFTELQALTIKGHAPGYEGKTLEFMTLSDPVTKTPLPFFTLTVGADGTFSAEATVMDPVYCYADFGIFRGRIFLQPGKEVSLQLPPLREKSFEESKNPYFEPVEIWLKTNGESDGTLTNQILKFDTRLFRLTDQYFNQLYYKQMKNYVDTVRTKLGQEFGTIKEPLFREHFRLRMVALEGDVMRAGREKIAGTLKNLSPEAWYRPAFIDFLNRLFVNTLSTESKSPAGANLRLWVARENLTELKSWTARFTATSSPLTDVILLKLLHDAWYSGEFSKNGIRKMVASSYFSSHHLKEIRTMASTLSEKITFLQPGTTAPEICLPSGEGRTWCSKANTRPYLYLLFADLEIPVCQEQVKYLKTLVEKTGGDMQVVVVAAPSSRINVMEFMSRHQVPGIVVTDTPQRQTGKLYKVRSWPSAFLLDRQHKVILAPARNPLDGFEFQFEDLKKTK